MAALPIDALKPGSQEEAQSLVNSLQELGDGMRALLASREAIQSETIRKALTADMRAWRNAIQDVLRNLSVSPVSEEATVLRSRLDEQLAVVEARIESEITAVHPGRIDSEEIENMYRLLGVYRRISEAMIASNNTPGHQTVGFAIPQSEWILQFVLPGRAVLTSTTGFFGL